MFTKIEKFYLKHLEKLKNKYVTSGWMQICSPEIAEILAQKNFDAITLDFEHGSFNFSSLNDIFRAIENEKKTSLVRLPNHNTENLDEFLTWLLWYNFLILQM